MSKKKSSSKKKDDEKNVDNSKEEKSPSIPLEDYEKIKDDYLRLAADFDNFKKRTEKDKENQLVGSLSIILTGLFPLIDNFEIAMGQEEVPKELEALYKLVLTFLENLNITEVPGVGEVREHLDDYFKTWEDVMNKKMEVHKILIYHQDF